LAAEDIKHAVVERKQDGQRPDVAEVDRTRRDAGKVGQLLIDQVPTMAAAAARYLGTAPSALPDLNPEGSAGALLEPFLRDAIKEYYLIGPGCETSVMSAFMECPKAYHGELMPVAAGLSFAVAGSITALGEGIAELAATRDVKQAAAQLGTSLTATATSAAVQALVA